MGTVVVGHNWSVGNNFMHTEQDTLWRTFSHMKLRESRKISSKSDTLCDHAGRSPIAKPQSYWPVYQHDLIIMSLAFYLFFDSLRVHKRHSDLLDPSDGPIIHGLVWSGHLCYVHMARGICNPISVYCPEAGKFPSHWGVKTTVRACTSAVTCSAEYTDVCVYTCACIRARVDFPVCTC